MGWGTAVSDQWSTSPTTHCSKNSVWLLNLLRVQEEVAGQGTLAFHQTSEYQRATKVQIKEAIICFTAGLDIDLFNPRKQY